jgi:DNA-binding transcriptional regulator GbsR (MarR family)
MRSGGGALTGELSLSSEIREFVESIGGYFAQYGLSAIAGRLMGLAMVTDRPLSLDDMAGALGVSRASVSTNIRMIKAVAFVEQVSLPNDRRDYYRCSRDPWGASLRTNIVAADALADIAQRGLVALQPRSGLAREQIEDLLDFCDFYVERESGVLRQWRAHRQQRLSSPAIAGAAPK